MRFFIGPMTKNVVDVVKEFSHETKNSIAMIPSRRQVEYNGGYVNNWTTQQFRDYASDLFLVRDHGGPGQGSFDDDGYKSLDEDCKNFNMIHIDPWKKYQNFEDGLDWSKNMIKFCHERNNNMLFEVGTEQAIRKFTAIEIEQMIQYFLKNLTSVEFEKIKYCVIQSGTSLKKHKNTGIYDESRLIDMVSVVKKYGLLSKEHNGDYLPVDLIFHKFSLGLDSINIAPEFGKIETDTYLKQIKEHKLEIFEDFWKICYESGKWKKWVDENFDPLKDKEQLIKICGHYVLSTDNFKKNISLNFPEIDVKIRKNIKTKLEELFSYGEETKNNFL